MTINASIRAYLDSKGIKQKFLAQQTGISAGKMSSILGEKRKITASEFLNICATLGVDPKTFSAGKE